VTPADPNPGALSNDALFTAVYDELKRLAHFQLRNGRGYATLSTTDLVHEAFLKLTGGRAGWDGRAHFFGAAARAMRQILVDYARRRNAAKRGGSWRVVSLSEAEAALQVEADDILALDEALTRLDSVNQRLRQVVELRFFGGASEEDIAGILGVSTRTVERDWLKARLLLLRELRPDPPSPENR
jgi:RNA polymerase sigma factor (TIGR02999 family)